MLQMDSYDLHFEKMNNFDLHPLSLSVSRLSPAKSSSSIDQYTHHRGKGDSAYSSFSGGSSAPDYHSPFLVDELHPHGLHYADLKYVKGVYGPNLIQSDSKNMHCQTMDVIAHQQQDHNEYTHVKHPPVPTTPETPPPVPPVRLESLKASRNLETSRGNPEGRYVQISNNSGLGPRPDMVQESRSSQNYQRTKNQEESENIQCSLQTDQCRQPQPQQHKGIQNLPPAYKGPHSGHHRTNSWHAPQHMISGNIQHKGQFYFITGVYKSSDSAVPQPHCLSDIVESHNQNEFQRSYSDICENVVSRHANIPDAPCGALFFQEKNMSNTPKADEEPAIDLVLNQFGKLEKTSPNVDFGDNQQVTNVNRHHTTNHPVFYCGPETSSSTSANQIVSPLNTNMDQQMHHRKNELFNKLSRQPFADVPTEKISKETTPLLYHLTGASRTSVMSTVKNDKHPNVTSNEQDRAKDNQKMEKDPRNEVAEKEKELGYPCGTLDDSFKKYYKAQLKDAQSKVLRETSFKRRDLQVSWPHRIEKTPDECLSEESFGPLAEDSHSKLEKPQPPTFQETGKESSKSCGDEKKSEKPKSKNIAQPQAPRIGWRKRLNLEQKKMSRSEPEKLNQLADGPTHMACRSLGSENETQLLEDNSTEQGLVASRRKVYETRGRAMSASSFSKSSLKHFQHKALLAYIERKKGTKVAESQQASPQVPSTGRLSDPTPPSGPKKKLLRPLSAGRILDLTSIQYSQFSRGHSRQSSWIEGQSTPTEASDSVQYLLDKEERPATYRSRSTSIPHIFHQIYKQMIPSSANAKDVSRAQIKLDESRTFCNEYAASVPDQDKVRMVAPRGKSMEELGVSKVWQPKVLSKSSEQLYQLKENHIAEIKDMDFMSQRLEQTREKGRQFCASLAASEDLSSELSYSTEPCASDHTSAVLHQETTTSITSVTPGADFSFLIRPKPSCDETSTVIQHSPVNDHGDKDPDMSSLPRGANLVASKIKAATPEQHLMNHQTSHGDVNEVHEVSLSPGVTTDPSLWTSLSDMDSRELDECPSQAQDTQPALCEGTAAALNLSPSDAKPQCSSIEGKGKEESEDKTSGKQLKQWETLVQEVVAADHSLAPVLFPFTSRKTAVMLMEQLLSADTLLMEEHYKKKQEQQVTAQQQTKYSRDVTADHNVSSPSASSESNPSETDVTEKKRQLMAHIEEQLKSLERLRFSLQEDQKENRIRGESMEALVRECCLPAELERYTQFIEDLERVFSLLLCLSARLARVENALSTADNNMDSEEKQSLESRHHFLCKQREDAKDLKDNLDRRERMVSTFLAKQLPEAQLQEYRRFVQIKAALLIRQKDLEEKQRVGEEQLEAVQNSIPP